MPTSRRPFWLLIFLLLGIVTAQAAPAQAAGLEASLDRSEITVDMNPPTVIQVSLANTTTAPIYLTGVKVQLSDGASHPVVDGVKAESLPAWYNTRI